MKTIANEPMNPTEAYFDGKGERVSSNDNAVAILKDYGLTKREHFAGLALQGLIAKYGTEFQKEHAHESVYMADQLIAELNK